MLSVVGEEYIAYSESVKGQYAPMVAIQKYDGTVTYREIVKEDLVRIKDDQTVPGGWIFRKSQSTTASWVKRFALARGAFVFFFHSPQNEKPIAVVPLEDCTLVAPEQGQKTFDEMRSYKANEGFEFDIRHNSRSTVRLYTLSEQERVDWMATCRARIEAAATKKALDGGAAPPSGGGNIMISSTKLSGLSLLSTASTSTGAFNTHTSSTLPPLPTEPYPYTATQTSAASSYPYPQGTGATSVAPPRSLSPSAPYRASVNQSGGPLAGAGGPVRMAGNYGGSSVYGGASVASYPGQSVAGGGSGRPAVYAAGAGAGPGRQSAPYLAPQKTAQSIGLNKFRSRKDLGFEFVLLEENLKKKLADQLEARNRESAAKVRLYDKDTIAAAQEKEAQSPLTLAELFRQMLCFIDEEVAEDPQEGTQLQLPHLKGQAVEEMLNAVYRRYCGESGFMSLEQFIEFFEDSAILHTHAPHNDNDEPVEEYVTLLDPVRLLTLVPRNIGFSVAETYDTVNAQLMAATKQDKFIINFSQFYMMLLRMTQIVYADLFEKDSTVAFNKILQEVICPLFVWCKGHHKRGSRDVLVLEERILLLMTTYAPNLYRVFLTYAHDAVGKVPEINRVFPESAQANERGMFKLPHVAPQPQIDSAHHTADSIFMTEAGVLRFTRDYGITPYVCSNRQVREIYKTVNRPKTIVSSRLPTRDMLTKVHSTAQISSEKRKKEPPNFKISTKSAGFGSSTAKDGKGMGSAAGTPRKAPPGGGSFKSAAPGAGVGAGSPSKTKRSDSPTEEEGGDTAAPPPPPAAPVIGGIGFSEFIEFVARVAVEGMQQENYEVVFPTPFSKVLAMLTVWGVADMRKLEEVRIIHTEEVYQ